MNTFNFKCAKVLNTNQRGNAIVATLFVRNSGKAIYPRIIIRNSIELGKALKNGDKIDGEGFIRAYNLKKENYKHHQYFVAENISYSKNLMEETFGKTGGKFYGNSNFEIKLSGKVVNIKHSEKFDVLTIGTDYGLKERPANYIMVKKPNNIATVMVNDQIISYCNLTTPKIAKKNKTEYRENIFVSDLVIEESA